MDTRHNGPLTRLDIADGLRRLGLSPGGRVIVHSSLKSFGQVEGGPLTVTGALMDVLTADGLLLMPSFNHGVPYKEGGAGYYDPAQTPTTNGAIPDVFWRQPGVFRSLDPTHAFAAWGRGARELIERHHRTLTLGPDSPLGWLGRNGGHTLLLGVTCKANTYHHVVETTLGAPCLGERTEQYPVRLSDGRTVPGRGWGWRERFCPINDTARYAQVMATRGMFRESLISQCHATLFRLTDCFAVIAELLSEGYAGFPPCSRCPIRPAAGPHTVKSDWDGQRQRPSDDSVAWSY